MVSTADRTAPRRGISRLGRIEGHARLPFVETPPAKPPARARFGRWAVLSVLLLTAGGIAWLFHSRVIAYALVHGDVITLTAPAGVIVEEMLVAPGEWCDKGRPLARLSPRETSPERERLDAQLKQARLRLALVERGGEINDLQLTRRFDERDRLAAEAEASRASVEGAAAEREFARKELLRQSSLQSSGHYSVREVNEAERDAAVAESGVGRAEAEQAGAERRWARQRSLVPHDADGADLRAIEIALLHESVREAEARLCEHDFRAGSRTVVAPISGYVDRVFVRAGSPRDEGEALLTLFDPATLHPTVYVEPRSADAFFPGAPVRLVVDGRSAGLEGRVESVHAAWDPMPPVLQRAYGGARSAITARIACDAPDQARLAPGMVLKVIAARR